MAGPVEAQHAQALGAEPLGEGREQVGRVARGAVDEQHRAALHALSRPVERVDHPAADRNALSRRVIARLGARRDVPGAGDDKIGSSPNVRPPASAR